MMGYKMFFKKPKMSELCGLKPAQMLIDMAFSSCCLCILIFSWQLTLNICNLQNWNLSVHPFELANPASLF